MCGSMKGKVGGFRQCELAKKSFSCLIMIYMNIIVFITLLLYSTEYIPLNNLMLSYKIN